MRIFFSCLFFGRRFGEVEHSRIVLIGHFVLDGVIKHLIEDLFQGQLNVIGRVVRYSASVDKGAVQQGVLDMRDSNSAHRHIVQVVCILPCAIGRGDISTAYFFGVFVDPALVKLLHGEYLRQVIGTLVVFHEGFIGIVIGFEIGDGMQELDDGFSLRVDSYGDHYTKRLTKIASAQFGDLAKTVRKSGVTPTGLANCTDEAGMQRKAAMRAYGRFVTDLHFAFWTGF